MVFGRLFGKSEKKPSLDEAHKLSAAVADSILNTVGAKNIPVMPGAAQKAFQLSTDPKAEARDFIEVIESDEALSARVLRIANSVYFDRGKPSKTIEESVLVIGMNELRCLLNSNTLSDIFPSSHPARTQLWANDVATALIARGLAQLLLPSKAEIAFLGGLMHDIGKLLLLQRAGDLYVKIVETVGREGVDFPAAEEREFVFDHTEVGYLIGERWNFTPELLAVIRNHHKPWSEVPKGSIIGIVKGADIIAHALGLGHPKGYAKFKGSCEARLDEVWDNLSLPQGDKKDLLKRFEKAYEVEYDLYSGVGK